jgi:hypothetical protein
LAEVDARTVRLAFSQVVPEIMDALTVPIYRVADGGVEGTGPYSISKLVPGQELELTRREGVAGGHSRVLILDQAGADATAPPEGTADVFVVTTDEMFEQVSQAGWLDVYRKRSDGAAYLKLGLASGRTADESLRRLIVGAIDRDYLRARLSGGAVVVGPTPTPGVTPASGAEPDSGVTPAPGTTPASGAEPASGVGSPLTDTVVADSVFPGVKGRETFAAVNPHKGPVPASDLESVGVSEADPLSMRAGNDALSRMNGEQVAAAMTQGNLPVAAEYGDEGQSGEEFHPGDGAQPGDILLDGLTETPANSAVASVLLADLELGAEYKRVLAEQLRQDPMAVYQAAEGFVAAKVALIPVYRSQRLIAVAADLTDKETLLELM